jgi:vacuolar-type H+-ATPase subunit I/STV1
MFDFIKNNFKTILKISFVVFILYWIVFVLTPKSQMAADQKAALDSLSIKIETLHQDNLKLENDIDYYNQKITEIDEDIDRVKNQKTIIKEYYHEKINSVDKLTVSELDSFFANRYNY